MLTVNPVYVLHAFLRNISEKKSEMSPDKQKNLKKKKEEEDKEEEEEEQRRP